MARRPSFCLQAALLAGVFWTTSLLPLRLGAFLAPGLAPSRLRGGSRAAWARRGAPQAPGSGAAGALTAAGLALVASASAAWGRHRLRDVARRAAKLTYFKLWAKGPSIALALQHSGMDWEGAFPEDWKTMKAATPFLELPVLEVPELGAIGHELAILNYIGQTSPKMAGADTKEFVVSQQLLQQAEDIYQKLTKLKVGMITGDEAEAFWTDENDQTHNRNFGVRVFLRLLEAFHAKCGVEGGKFTSSGTTVGECKLFATLHTLKLIKDDILTDFPGLSSFYDRFAAEEATQAILNGTGKMPGQFAQYFKF